jgi:hypothetical protein
MGWRDLFKRKDEGCGVDELARRLRMDEPKLRAIEPAYRRFTIPKRSGGTRTILAPESNFKAVQRTILRRLLARLPAHPNVTGFERGHSIVTNALPHVGKVVVVRMDLTDFFTSTTSERVRAYFCAIGWNKGAAALLARLCTHDGGLPQGAPTSPRLGNLVNYRMDTRLTAMAAKVGASYSRYADDLTFSFAVDDPKAIHAMIRFVKQVVDDEGYRLHQRRKLHIRRRHNRQLVTGLVVNQRANLPRATRRRLRAIEHHLATGRDATLAAAQLSGWKSLRLMIARQSASEPRA